MPDRPYPPDDFEQLREKTKRELEELGMKPWTDRRELYLFPSHWYEHIPEGYEVTALLYNATKRHDLDSKMVVTDKQRPGIGSRYFMENGLLPFAIEAKPMEWEHDPPDDFEQLREKTKEELKEMGLQPWGEDPPLLLFPFNWYEHIPEGYEVTSISGQTLEFSENCTTTIDEQLFGHLPYGIEP